MWSEGDLIVQRQVLNDGRCWLETSLTVIRDEPGLLVTYVAPGAPFHFPEDDWPTANGKHPWHGRTGWEGHGSLRLSRPGDSYSVWVFWDGPDREFTGWYVNFEEPFRRHARGIDTQDLELDLIVHPDGRWELKDEEALELRVAEGRFTNEQAHAAREAAARLIAEFAAGSRWWDSAWADWQPPA